MAEQTLKNNAPTNNHSETTEEARTVTVTPRVDVIETEHDFVLVADLPGVLSQDVDIRFEKGELSVHGRRQAPTNGTQLTHREYEATNYHRAFTVAETISADKISADLKNGVLTVRLPKVEAVKPKKIAVRG